MNTESTVETINFNSDSTLFYTSVHNNPDYNHSDNGTYFFVNDSTLSITASEGTNTAILSDNTLSFNDTDAIFNKQ